MANVVANTGSESLSQDELYEMQRRIEQDMADLLDFKKLAAENKTGGEFAHSRVGNRMLANHIEDVRDAMAAVIEKAQSGTAGPGYAGLEVIFDEDVACVAAAGIKALLQCIHEPYMTVTACAARLGRRVQTEMYYHKLSREKGNALARKRASVRAGSQRKHMDLDPDMPFVSWPPKTCVAVGYALLNAIIERTGWIEVHTSRTNRRVKMTIKRTKLFYMFAQYWVQTQVFRPQYLPMVVPPNNWDSDSGGGYVTDLIEPITFLRVPGKAGRNRAPNTLYAAINQIQSVPWRINRKVYDVFSEAVRLEYSIGGLPLPIDQLYGVDWVPRKDNETPDERAARATHNRRLHHQRQQAFGRWFLHRQIDRLARDYVGYDRIWFPTSLDFRGRIYPVPVMLNPQGNDAAKGLLEFTEGKPLSASGWRWLKIHGANCWDNGLTKKSYAERITWIELNEERILTTAEAPLDYTWWSGAEDGWQFLAFCFEYARLKADPSAPSTLPVSQDGTCNGLQHFSAMLRDPVGGAATNLTAGERPRDIYQLVADRVNERLVSDATETSLKWLDLGIDRKACKRQVMTLPYGSTRWSCYTYTREWYDEKTETIERDVFMDIEQQPALVYLSNIIWDSIGDVVVAARAAMDWLRQVANIVGANAVTWTSPTGLRVTQAYKSTRHARISTFLNGKIFVPRLLEETDKIDIGKQRNGISPNFVHSYDAAHVIATCNALTGAGVREFGFVHDSYVSLAEDADTVARLLRETFAALHEQPALDVLAKEIRAQGHDIPDPPPCGDLDLGEVLKSPYFFA